MRLLRGGLGRPLSRRFPITLWLARSDADPLPALTTSAQIMRAPLKVLPAPGGPWIASTARPGPATVRTAKSTGRLGQAPAAKSAGARDEAVTANRRSRAPRFCACPRSPPD